MTSTTATVNSYEQYERAAARAQASGIRVTGRGYRKADGVYVYTVSSASQPNVWHIVAVEDDELACDCQAGSRGVYCKHVALVTEVRRAQVEERLAEAKVICAKVTQERRDAERDAMPLHRDNRPFSIWKDETQDSNLYCGRPRGGAQARTIEAW